MKSSRAPAVGLASAAALMAAATVVPVATGWDVRAGFGPLSAHWDPRVGAGTLVAVPLALAGVAYGCELSRRLRWHWLLVVGWLVGLAWLASLALVDGSSGLTTRFDTDDLMTTARQTSDIPRTLSEFVSRIPMDDPHSWPVHVAGHPPGALLFFVMLARLGLGNLAVGIVVTLAASTIPLAVLSTLRTLGAEGAARSAAAFLVLAPAAIWEAVSADAVFAAVGAWALAVLALAAVRRSICWSLVAGLLFGACVLMSYGLPLLALLAIAVLVVARSYRPLPWVAAATVVVILVFWVLGFSLWDAYPALRQRYLDGIAGYRPAAYWVWGDLAALCFSAGPVVGAGVACWVSRLRGERSMKGVSEAERAVFMLGGAATLAILVADLSLMSKAEVERIWLPFIPWLLILCALLPLAWRRRALAGQVVLALLVQHLLRTLW